MIKNNRGFTLLELVVTICLIAIIAGFAIPSLTNAVPGIALKSAANDLVSDMRLARAMAVKNQELVTMSFNTVTGSYQIASITFNKTVTLSDYRGGITFGGGMATKAASTGAAPFPGGYDFVSFQFNNVNFKRNGMCTRTGYAYLCNGNSDKAYAAGLTSTAGVVSFKKTDGTDLWITL